MDDLASSVPEYKLHCCNLLPTCFSAHKTVALILSVAALPESTVPYVLSAVIQEKVKTTVTDAMQILEKVPAAKLGTSVFTQSFKGPFLCCMSSPLAFHNTASSSPQVSSTHHTVFTSHNTAWRGLGVYQAEQLTFRTGFLMLFTCINHFIHTNLCIPFMGSSHL